MSAHDWRDLDEQLDRAIDALNGESTPHVTHAEVESLLAAARAVRRLRTPAEPDDNFVERLVAATPDTVALPNGVAPSSVGKARPIAPFRRPRLRRISLVAAALRSIGVCVLAGIIAGGLIGGLGGRAAMRVSGYMYERENPGQVAITQSSEEPVGRFSLGGTWSLVVETALFDGVAGGLVYLLVASWLPRRGWARGLVFSGLLLLAGGWIVISSDNTDFSELGSPVVNVIMFGGLIAAYGLAVPWIADRLGRAAAHPAAAGRGGIGTIAVRTTTIVCGAFGLLVMAMMFAFISYAAVSGVIGFSPGSTALSFVLLALIALVLIRVAAAFPTVRNAPRFRRIAHSRTLIAVLAALVALTGAGLTLWSIVEILAR